MNISQLLGPHVDPAFTKACEEAENLSWRRGYADYPSFDLEHQYSESYASGYTAAYHDDIDAREDREADRREFPRSAEIDRRNGL